MKEASLSHDKAEFARKLSSKVSKSAAKRELVEIARKKRNEDLIMLMKVLAVFLIFDFVTREILF